MILVLLAGFAGGVIRGLVGFIKYQYSYKSVPFKLWYFLLMVLLFGIVGLSAGWVIKGVIDTEVFSEIINVYAFIAGYAGGDFIENVFKIILKKPSLYPIPEITELKK